MLTSHGEQLIAEAQIFDARGKLKRVIIADNDQRPAPHEIEVIVRNSDNSIDRIVKYPFRSFTYNWSYLFRDWMSDVGTTSAKLKTDSTTYSNMIPTLYFLNPYTSYYGGIVVGRSSTTPTISDPYLYTVCANGTATNQFDYSSTVVEEPVYSSPYYQILIRRVLTNYSGASITVREVALIANSSSSYSGNQYMLARDTVDYLGNPINLSVGHEQSFEVKYYLRFSTSSGFVINHFKALYALVASTQNYRLTETDGSTTTNINLGQVHDYWDTTAAYGVDTHGIVVGMGPTAPVYTDFQLDNMIAHGSVDGRLLYGAMEYANAVIDGSDSYYQIRRAFVNDGAINVNITEAGVVGYNSANTARAMLTHVPFSGITLQPTESMRVIFTFKVSN